MGCNIVSPPKWVIPTVEVVALVLLIAENCHSQIFQFLRSCVRDADLKEVAANGWVPITTSWAPVSKAIIAARVSGESNRKEEKRIRWKRRRSL